MAHEMTTAAVAVQRHKISHVGVRLGSVAGRGWTCVQAIVHTHSRKVDPSRKAVHDRTRSSTTTD